MKHKMVHVTWVDSSAFTGWREIETGSALLCSSVAFLVEKNAERLILALNYSHGEGTTSWGQHMHIPMCAVKKIRYLK